MWDVRPDNFIKAEYPTILDIQPDNFNIRYPAGYPAQPYIKIKVKNKVNFDHRSSAMAKVCKKKYDNPSINMGEKFKKLNVSL